MQIAGIILVGDMTGLTTGHMPSNWTDARAWSDFMSGGCPVWFHKIHIVNGPWIFGWLYNLAKPFLSDYAARVGVVSHPSGQWETLHQEV